MATLIITVIISAISPMLLLQAATRIQNRRAEQAIELAQGEVDRVRVLMSQGVTKSDESDKLPPSAGVGITISEVIAPSSTVTNSDSLDDFKKALEVDTNSDGKTDFFVQTFRDDGIRFDGGLVEEDLAVFRMGVRVYSVLAKENLGGLKTEKAAVNITNGIGDQKLKPLAVIYTEISHSDINSKSLDAYAEYLQ